MELDIREMINGGPARLRYVFRYSTSRVEHPESVAEHSYFVAFYCMMIAEWIREHPPLGGETTKVMRATAWDQAGNPIKWEEAEHLRTEFPVVNELCLLKRALLHDMEEAVSGDFPRNFKHSTPELKQMLDVAAEHAFLQLMEPLLSQKSGIMSGGVPNHVDRFLHYWTDSKDESYEGRILEFADYLAVLGFLMQEGAHDGNKVVKQHVAEMRKYLGKFQRDKFDFIRPLVEQATQLTQEVL